MPDLAGNSCTAALNAFCCALARAGGTPSLLENQSCRTAFAEGGGPPSDGMGIPFQCLRRSRGRPALGQHQHGAPPPELAEGPAPGASAPQSSAGANPWLPAAIVRETALSPSHASPTPLSSRKANPVPPQLYPMPLHISLWLWFRLSPVQMVRLVKLGDVMTKPFPSFVLPV